MEFYKINCFIVSKRILTLGVKDDPQPRPKALQLQKMIRYTATLFVQVRPCAERVKHTFTHTRYYEVVGSFSSCYLNSVFLRSKYKTYKKLEIIVKTNHFPQRNNSKIWMGLNCIFQSFCHIYTVFISLNSLILCVIPVSGEAARPHVFTHEG